MEAVKKSKLTQNTRGAIREREEEQRSQADLTKARLDISITVCYSKVNLVYFGLGSLWR